MDTLERNKQGHQLTNAKRIVLIGKMYDLLTKGYMSTNRLAKELRVNQDTIDTYRPLVNDLISKKNLDRTVVRNLELQRAYRVIEMIMQDLERTEDVRQRVLLYNQIAKHSSRIALITGLNIETQVNVDQRQLVIIRADNNKKPIIDIQDSETDKTIEQKTTDKAHQDSAV